MEGNRIVLDDRHAVRQHKVFAMFVVAGLLIIGAVWYIQVRMAIDKGALTEIRSGIEGLSEGWSKSWETPMPVAAETPTAEVDAVSDTAVTDAVQDAMQELEVRQEVGRQVSEAMK